MMHQYFNKVKKATPMDGGKTGIERIKQFMIKKKPLTGHIHAW